MFSKGAKPKFKCNISDHRCSLSEPNVHPVKSRAVLHSQWRYQDSLRGKYVIVPGRKETSVEDATHCSKR